MTVNPPRGVFIIHVRDWRTYRAWSQAQLADRAGVALSTVTRAEKGLNINGSSARKLAEALSITVEDFYREPPASSAAAQKRSTRRSLSSG